METGIVQGLNTQGSPAGARAKDSRKSNKGTMKKAKVHKGKIGRLFFRFVFILQKSDCVKMYFLMFLTRSLGFSRQDDVEFNHRFAKWKVWELKRAKFNRKLRGWLKQHLP